MGLARTRTTLAFGLAFAVGVLAGSPARAQDEHLEPTGRWTANTEGNAPVPPIGWNSWNAFNSDIDEVKVMASAQVLLDSGLASLGYRYVNLDDGWWLRRRQPDGRMVIRTDKFPSAAIGPHEQTSFRPLTDRLHAMGLRAGIYSDIGRNSCGQVYTPHFANQPEGTIAEREVGLHDHVDQDIELYFEEWGFDGQLLSRSVPKKFGDAAETLSAEVAGVSLIGLVARTGGGHGTGGGALPVVWGDAALTR